MTKFQVIESIEWEGVRKWTVFANDRERAKELVKADRRYSGESLTVNILKDNITGTNKESILKYTETFYP